MLGLDLDELVVFLTLQPRHFLFHYLGIDGQTAAGLVDIVCSSKLQDELVNLVEDLVD